MAGEKGGGSERMGVGVAFVLKEGGGGRGGVDVRCFSTV